MKLDIATVPAELVEVHPAPGDIYRKAGNQPGFWLIVSVRPTGYCHLLSFDMNGEVTGCASYGWHYFADRGQRLVGRTPLPDLLNVEWLP
jgi:hypothetical protein